MKTKVYYKWKFDIALCLFGIAAVLHEVAALVTAIHS